MKKILVIEDTPSLREGILEVLHTGGFEVVGAENGRIGVQLAREYRPDLIICDVMMPELDGYHVLAALRQDPTTATIPFIFLPSRGAREDIRQGMGIGADDYLTKPFKIEELLSAVRTRLERQAAVSKKFEDLRVNISTALPHELRTPLTGIIGFSQMLKDPSLTFTREETAEIGKAIYDSGLRLKRLIENYLLYVDIGLIAADPEKTKALSQTSIVNPGEIVGVIAKEKAKDAHREADLILQVTPTEELQMAEDHFRKIIEELVDNALKFSQAGTPVRITAVVREGTFTLSVMDSGRGMTPEQIANIGAYMQFDRKLYEQQGSGLGLAIVKGLVELYEGQLSITSVPHQQTTVCIQLKCALLGDK